MRIIAVCNERSRSPAAATRALDMTIERDKNRVWEIAPLEPLESKRRVATLLQ
jgi:hypothetical protein